jgi:hypothetical protein
LLLCGAEEKYKVDLTPRKTFIKNTAIEYCVRKGEQPAEEEVAEEVKESEK